MAAVNDAPFFTAGPDVFVLPGSATIVSEWASGISPGPPDEAGQAVTFQVGAVPGEFFAMPPAIDSSGTLKFTLTSDATGTADVQVFLRDNGGTDRGGVDTSDPQTFRIHVIPSDLLVTTAVDEDDGGLGLGQGDSLRETIAAANAFPDHNTIAFALPAGSTISLSAGPLPVLVDDVTILGPGAHELSIGENPGVTIFQIGVLGALRRWKSRG